MEEKLIKSQNRTKVFIAFIGLIGIIVGTFGTTIYNQYFSGTITVPSDNSLSYAMKQNGIYIFFRSIPHDKYIKLGTPINTDVASRAIENAEGKKGLGNILKGVSNSLLKDLSFENRLTSIIDKVI